MTKLLSIISLILILLLFPPTVLALISNNAVPGDSTYPIKRKLEDGILLGASITPGTKAMFSTNRSNRRFDETKILIAKGNQEANKSLDELVLQTTIAASQIEEIKDPVQKEQLKQQLTELIQKYNQNLNQIQKQVEKQTSTPVSVTPTPVIPTQFSEKTTPSPTPVLIITPTLIPPATQIPVPVLSLTPTPTVSPTVIVTRTPTPTPTPSPSPSPSPTITPAPVSGDNPPVSADKLDDVQKKLKDIQDKLRRNNKRNNRDR